jgi:hypothetical protein
MLSEKLLDIFEPININIRESKSAIKGFTKQYTIDGWNGTDADRFLKTVKPKVISLLSKNRQTKINMVLTCTMERVDMKSGEVISDDIPFLSRTGIILESTDVNEAHDEAVEKIVGVDEQIPNERK